MISRPFGVYTVLFGMVACAASAQSPLLVNYQGRMADGGGLVNGNVDLVLRLFDAPVGGNLLYQDSNQVAVVDGLYSTHLGDGTIYGTLAGALSQSQVWLEVSADGADFSPREQWTAAPYALVTHGFLVTTNYAVILNPESSGNRMGQAVFYRVSRWEGKQHFQRELPLPDCRGGFQRDS